MRNGKRKMVNPLIIQFVVVGLVLIHIIAVIIAVTNPFGCMLEMAQIGDYFGGVYGTALSIVTTLVVVISYLENQKDAEERRAKDQLYKMIDYLVQEIHEVKYGDKYQGKLAFSRMIGEVGGVIKYCINNVPALKELNNHAIADITYNFLYLGYILHIPTKMAPNSNLMLAP